VIGLASVSSAEIQDDLELPEALYRFFAEEVFGALGPDLRAYLATLATLPLLDRELVGELLVDDADHVLMTALDVGVLVERGTRIEIHPLARAFLEERHERLGLAPDPAACAIALTHYRKRRDWDAAFELIARRHLIEELEPFLDDALNELLDTARLSTVETWCSLAVETGLDSPLFSVARAEISLRHGRHGEAQIFAESAARTGSPYAFRALSIAGRAAHLASREEEALEFYKRAEQEAATGSDRRDACWGQLMCLIDLESDDALEAFENLVRDVHPVDARDFVRAAAYRLSYQAQMSTLDLAPADIAWQMISAVRDPLVRSAFEGIYGHSLILSARYEEALEVAQSLLATSERYRLDFAVPYGLVTSGLAHAGRRNWGDAELCLRTALDRARRSQDAHAEQHALAALIRTLAQQGLHEAALALPLPELGLALPAMRAELIASRALALASANRIDEAVAALAELRGVSRSAEQAVLTKATAAIVALKRNVPSAIAAVDAVEQVAFDRGIQDLLVVAYRSSPELLAVLLRSSRSSSRTAELVRRVGDDDLAEALGQPVATDCDPVVRLTKRELEIYELLCNGLANRQIAELLVISESTVKLHVHHIYDKLGVRSRATLVIQAALRRSDQATSATLDSGTTGSS
jgi:DNA-binding NarL/FixJ family response regulator